MSYNLVFSKKIELDLQDIAFYIAQDNPVRAITFVDELISYFHEILKYFPFSGKKVKGKIRRLTYKRYVILYDVNEKKKLVTLLHIFAGGQDWKSLYN